MRTYALTSRKGGSGKTTCTTALAGAIAAQGRCVVVIDLDPQGTLSGWCLRREEADTTHTIHTIQTTHEGLEGTLDACRSANIDTVLLDTRPEVQETAHAAVHAADFVIVPCRPSPADLEAIGATLGLADEHGTPAGIVLTQARRNSVLLRQARRVLEGYEVPICPVAVPQADAFVLALMGGLTIDEYAPRDRATRDVAKIAAWIEEQMNAQTKTQHGAAA